MKAPTRQWSFTVSGRGRFPLDMLRYDSCWPQSGTGAATMARVDRLSGLRNEVAEIDLLSWKEPTPQRWASFGWVITRIDHGRVAS